MDWTMLAWAFCLDRFLKHKCLESMEYVVRIRSIPGNHEEVRILE